MLLAVALALEDLPRAGSAFPLSRSGARKLEPAIGPFSGSPEGFGVLPKSLLKLLRDEDDMDAVVPTTAGSALLEPPP